MENEKMVIDAFVNAIGASACAFALRDVLLTTVEQKEQYNAKYKEYTKKLLLQFAEQYGLNNPEKLFEKLLSQAPLG